MKRTMIIGKTKRWTIIRAGPPAREHGARFFPVGSESTIPIGLIALPMGSNGAQPPAFSHPLALRRLRRDRR